MIYEEATKRIFEVLNRALASDSEAISKLIATRVPCNETLADDPEIQVGKTDEGYTVGLLGLLNGVAGTLDAGKKKGWGPVTAVVEDDGSVSGFQLTCGDE